MVCFAGPYIQCFDARGLRSEMLGNITGCASVLITCCNLVFLESNTTEQAFALSFHMTAKVSVNRSDRMTRLGGHAR